MTTATPDLTGKTIIRLPEVMKKTGLSRATIYRRMAAGTFPKSISIGDSEARQAPVGWLLDEIEAWIAQRINGRTVAGHTDQSAAA
ncbi:hypothetical protein BVH03_22285 [Pseudomonas sp. PA15(2017)]|uniref:helix-turn-helix transcriptional regulator n=1 Tax=Pseudomonas sp. PA15(2017) TaxID=1932111 RepID=UPI00095DF49E|nr:AlpA family transcriptional regulator [Pseudomonas sp. PA15(2017)]OLU23317.1 hypothetical protein BVH03_22285 [Pseudomonas sp. PA15(2017)]